MTVRVLMVGIPDPHTLDDVEDGRHRLPDALEGMGMTGAAAFIRQLEGGYTELPDDLWQKYVTNYRRSLRRPHD